MTKQNTNLIIHCSDTFASMDIGPKEIRRWHVEERGWLDIGYNWVIDRQGVLHIGRDLDGDGSVDDEVGAHAFGYNGNSVGVCMVGGRGYDGEPENNFTKKQFKALDVLVAWYELRYPGIRVMGHNEVSSKACPSFDVQERYGKAA